MIDLHTHSIFSDGELIPAELVQRAKVTGYKALAITDHADHSNIDFVIPRLVKIASILSHNSDILVIPGIELTHVPPAYINELTKEARCLGARLVLVHGETIAEPVASGTNFAAVNSDIDILAHPGLITEEEGRVAAKRGILLEITSRKGHSLTNGHVANMARFCGANLVFDTDTHGPEDLVSQIQAEKIARGAGMTAKEISVMLENSRRLCERIQGS